jgi:hypothetical protein
MAFLCAQVDTDMILMLGRCRSDEMLRYAHLSTEPLMCDHIERINLAGSFVLYPNQGIPVHLGNKNFIYLPLPAETVPEIDHPHGFPIPASCSLP